MTIISCLNGILKPEHISKGLRLVEEDDDNIVLLLHGKRLAVFTQHTTAELIREEADKWEKINV